MNKVLSVMFNNNKKCTQSIELAVSTYVLQSEILIESGLHIQMWGAPPQIWTWSSTFQGQDNQEFLVFLERLIYNKTITCIQREIHTYCIISFKKKRNKFCSPAIRMHLINMIGEWFLFEINL